MNRHAGPPAGATAPAVPEPSYAERARTLAHLGDTATLATLSRKHPGHPFASVMPYALDGRGRPIMLISSMAMHTQNLMADARASLLVAQPTAGDPLAAARLTLMGHARTLPKPEIDVARAAYLARHANARYWVDFEDFGFWRLEPTDLYFVGGFGAMDWVASTDYMAAEPDPLVDVSESILRHMNEDHAGALLAYLRGRGRESTDGGAPPDEATLVAVDRLGFKVRLRTGERVHGIRVAFPREVATAAQCREAFTEMFRSRADESQDNPRRP
jgi:putative heme iron utilization protein